MQILQGPAAPLPDACDSCNKSKLRMTSTSSQVIMSNASHHFSTQGLRSISCVKAVRGWVWRCQYASAIYQSPGKISKYESARRLKIQGSSLRRD